MVLSNGKMEGVRPLISSQIQRQLYHIESFAKMFQNRIVVNDMSERHIKLVEDYIHRSRNEELKQDIFQVVKSNYSSFPINPSKASVAKKSWNKYHYTDHLNAKAYEQQHDICIFCINMFIYV